MAELHHPHAGETPQGPTDNVDVHHEESDVDIRAIFGFGAALLAVGVVVHVLILLLFNFFDARATPQAQAAYPLAVGQEDRRPEPRLQEHPREDLGALRDREEETLRSYGWVDRNAGVVRIPIERAMELTLERGLPARPARQETAR
jgi:hypothetical protein